VCTLTLAWQVFEGTPVVAAANRDEYLGRPSSPPSVWEDVAGGDGPLVVAPRDEAAGGTWIGYNGAGVLAAITNRWVDADLAGERSRGLLVRDALDHETAEEATRYVERTVEEFEYEGFNLVVADDAAAILLEWDGSLRVRTLTPGVHVVVNVGADGSFVVPAEREEMGSAQAENAADARTRLRPEPGETTSEWLDRARAVLSDHDVGLCVHRDGENYGTRSSSLITIGEAGTRYEFADGPPCEADYHPVAVDKQI